MQQNKLFKFVNNNIHTYILSHICIILLFFFIYLFLKNDLYYINHSKLTNIDILYFTIVTHSGTGYGDISPISQRARLICSIHMLIPICINIGILLNL